MVSDAQQHFADASFPPELRLQVMKSGVPYNTTCKLSLSESLETAKGLRDQAHGLLLSPPRELWYQLDPWADQVTSDIVKSTAELAFLETVIFELGVDDLLHTARREEWGSGSASASASFAETIGARIHYLNLTIAIECYYGLNGEQFPIDVTWFRQIITCLGMLKSRLTNLKACVLTLDIHISPFCAPPTQPFDRTILSWVQ